MILPMFLLLVAAVFVTQLVFCFCAKKPWIKLLPVCITGALSIVCWLLYFTGIFSDIYGGDFAVFIYGIVLLLVTVVACFAWLVYALVQHIKAKDQI